MKGTQMEPGVTWVWLLLLLLLLLLLQLLLIIIIIHFINGYLSDTQGQYPDKINIHKLS